MRKLVVASMLGLALLAPARAQVVEEAAIIGAEVILNMLKNAIFGNEVYEEGIVNYVQPSWFSIMHDGTFTRILMPPGTHVPFQMQVGNNVGVTAKPDQYGNWYLVEVEKLSDAIPLPPPTPGR